MAPFRLAGPGGRRSAELPESFRIEIQVFEARE
jgi:hypothetical protein